MRLFNGKLIVATRLCWTLCRGKCLAQISPDSTVNMARIGHKEESQNRSEFRIVLIVFSFLLVPVQGLLLYMLWVGNGQYDDPHAGMDPGTLIYIVGFFSLYLTLFVIGVLVASFTKTWIALAIQLLMPIVIVFIYVFGTTYDASSGAYGVSIHVNEPNSALVSASRSPDKTTGQEITQLQIGDVIIHLQKMDDGSIEFELNDHDYGILSKDDVVRIDAKRHVTVNGVARMKLED